MDADNIQFPDALFDAILCAFGLMDMPDPLRTLQEMQRVRRPGGRVVAAVCAPRPHSSWAAMVPLGAAWGRSDGYPLGFRLGMGDVLAQMVQTAGFTAVMCEHLRTVWYCASAEDACAAGAGGPVALAAPATSRQGRGYAIPGACVITNGRKR